MSSQSCISSKIVSKSSGINSCKSYLRRFSSNSNRNSKSSKSCSSKSKSSITSQISKSCKNSSMSSIRSRRKIRSKSFWKSSCKIVVEVIVKLVVI